VIGRLARLPAERRAMLAEALLALGVSSLGVAVVPFRKVLALVRPAVPGNAAPEDATVAAVRWAVSAAARRVPWRAKCLEQALAAQWMLRRRGVRATIFYGVSKAPGGLEAHAWVRTAQRDVIGCEIAADFTELARFPPAD
jgi:hypothetical protein